MILLRDEIGPFFYIFSTVAPEQVNRPYIKITREVLKNKRFLTRKGRKKEFDGKAILCYAYK